MIVLFFHFKNALLESFDEEMKMRASVVAGRTSVDPRIVPLPQQNENFIIIYDNTFSADTIFAPPGNIFEQRHVRIEENVDDSVLTIIYTIPSAKVDKTIRRLFVFITFFLLAGIVLSGLLGRYFSGKIIRPVNQVINLANEVDIRNHAHLLQEPDNNDELKQLIVSFNRMLLRIGEQTERQNAFFASASHELRTPLSVMQTRMQVLLQDEAITTDTKNAYTAQLEDVRRLIKMVNDFLLMSKLQSANLQIIKQECYLPEMIADIVSRNKAKTQERNLKFKISFLPEEKPFMVMADNEKLQIIINNLIHNSIKYSEENSVIEIKLMMENAPYLLIKNKIRKDIHPEMIDLKKQFHHSKPLHGEGFGLGLWFSNQLAMLQGVELFVSISEKIYFEANLIMKG